jgi:hypothetical protein
MIRVVAASLFILAFCTSLASMPSPRIPDSPVHTVAAPEPCLPWRESCGDLRDV